EGTALDDVILIGHEPIPQCRDSKHRTIHHAYVKRLSMTGSASLPDIEACDRDDTALAVEPDGSIVLGGLDRRGPHARHAVWHGLPNLRGLGGGRHETPPHHDAFRFLVMHASRWDAVRRSNVESSLERPPGIVDAELLLNLFSVRDDNSFAHDSKRTTVESESELSPR